MARYHIGKNGPAACRASKRPCPLGGQSGDENHYDSLEKAQKAFEQQMSSEHSNSLTHADLANVNVDNSVKSAPSSNTVAGSSVSGYSSSHSKSEDKYSPRKSHYSIADYTPTIYTAKVSEFKKALEFDPQAREALESKLIGRDIGFYRDMYGPDALDGYIGDSAGKAVVQARLNSEIPLRGESREAFVARTTPSQESGRREFTESELVRLQFELDRQNLKDKGVSEASSPLFSRSVKSEEAARAQAALAMERNSYARVVASNWVESNLGEDASQEEVEDFLVNKLPEVLKDKKVEYSTNVLGVVDW